MNNDSKEIIILETIKSGIKSFNKISKITHIITKELEQILEKLESKKLIIVNEKNGIMGKKVEINITKKGEKDLDNRIYELRGKWDQMIQLYESGDKQKLEKYIEENNVSFKQMMFFGILDMAMFSMMFSMIGMTVPDFIASQDTS